MTRDSLRGVLSGHFAAAIAQVAGTTPEQIDPVVRPAGDPKFGDYQCNAALGLSKLLRTRPRELAERIRQAVEPQLSGVAESVEVAGAGFINIRLKDEFLGRCLTEIPPPPTPRPGARPDIDRVGLEPSGDPLRVVIDYSQPNIAKQMHVGHLRSTIIGDVLARVLAFQGHEVIRQNHIGDWGTQFGILIRYYQDRPLPTRQTHSDPLQAIEDDYRSAQERFDRDQQFAAEARQAVRRLQSGDPEARGIWEQICALSHEAFTEIYRRLGVLLEPADVRGESFYNDRLPAVVAELRAKLPAREWKAAGQSGLPLPDAGPEAPGPAFDGPEPTASAQARAEVRDDQGAVCVFIYDSQGRPLFRNPQGQALPMIIQKSDGAYLYATTDLAAIRFRIRELRAQRIIYVTDARQKLHFQMLFATARAAGWLDDRVKLEHITFGAVLGPDRRPLKTREGRNIRLRDLLDEAERRAYRLLEERDRLAGQAAAEAGDEVETTGPTRLAEPEKLHIARRVGIAAIKYADLRNDRNADYVFDWDKMLALQGNTAPYLMYAYARIRSIYRKAALRFGSPEVYGPQVQVLISHPTERALALRLLRLGEVVSEVGQELTPHTLCTYLYDLAADFMRFYESCPVLAAPDHGAQLSRMRLCDLTARTLKLGLWLLGIEAIERM